MLPEFFHIPRCSFFSDAYTLLSVISWVGKALVVVEFHGFSPLYLLYHKNTTHTTHRREKFDKKRPPLGGFWGISIYSTVKDPDVSIIGRGTNNTDKNLYGEPGAVFYDSDNNVVGFCYGLESFDAGQTKSFEISGDMMSEEYDPSIVDHVDVFMQGNTY